MKKTISIITACLLICGATACGGTAATDNRSIELSKDVLSLGLFGQTELTATKNNISGAMEWSNSNPDVLEMTQDGEKVTVIAKNEGIAKITVTAGGKKDECTVQVTDDGTRMYLSSPWQGEVNMVEGSSLALAAETTFRGDVFDRATVTYLVDDPSVATVDEDGVVTAVAVGSATVTAIAEYMGRTSNAMQTVVTVASSTILKTNLANVELYEINDLGEFPSQTACLVAIQDGEQEVSLTDADYTSESADESIAVLENGVIKAVSIGVTQIKITTVYEGATYTSTLHVNVQKIPELSVTLNKDYISLYTKAITTMYPVEEQVKVNALVNGEKSEDVVFEWSVTEGSDVVSVSDAGVVKALKAGEAKVTVRVCYGLIVSEASCEITVFDSDVDTMVFDGSVFLMMNDNGDTYEKVGDNYVFTKYSEKITSGDLKLNVNKLGILFTEGNWIVIKLKSSVNSWLVLDVGGNCVYSGYTTDFKATANQKTPQGEGYAIYQIGSKGGYTGEVFWSSSQGSQDVPVVFEIESVTICTTDGYKSLTASSNS